ncbi:MAG: putative selenate reductase subunit YgfK [Ignavibacteriaceae bacterium]|nr:putative selenate reductase subunit YgfK [Ignavibacteriaceae bacterium]
MSDKLYCYPIEKLFSWILNEEKQGTIFGYSKNLFFNPDESDLYKIKRYEQSLENPLGVAAGPHTQMSQNIILSWLFGARYIELKTVQVLDDIEVTKPCIDMGDEGYNCEWSQELKITESFDEYLNAWIIIHLLKDKFGWGKKENGFIFNLSAGYDLKGIKSEKVQWFFNKMNDASDEIAIKLEQLYKIYPRVKDIKIPSMLSNNITLSTMHGCPPDEIENIAKYLIEERKLHTAVKLNPTLLGPEMLRNILNDKLGFKIAVPDAAFEHDLKYDDAIGLITRLEKHAALNNVEFGIKLTNTLEALNPDKFLPKKEKMVYMSGRALHPISVNLAAKLQNQFNGTLDISFSAGADTYNFSSIIKCGIKPVTICSDILKPGGYSRMPQYLQFLQSEITKSGSKNIDEFIQHNTGGTGVAAAALHNLNAYAEEVLHSDRYQKHHLKNDSIKTMRELTPQDCVQAPCVETCAIKQDVPEYMYHTANGDFDKAYKSILEDNPLPNTTGMVCDHLCQTKCTRMNIDNSLLIREIKRFVSEKESANFITKNILSTQKKAAIIGAGPSGLSAAYFLALAGFEVEVFESKSFAGGMASGAIPVFRINLDAVRQDVKNIASLGVKFNYEYSIDETCFKKIVDDFDFVYIAIGAQKGKQLNIEGENLENIFDQLKFLADTLNGNISAIGKNIAIIGGGNSAMDAARTAKRLAGKDGIVKVIYRRTINQMPADKEEIEALLNENIELVELTAPLKITRVGNALSLNCIKMKLREADKSGRPRPVQVPGSEFTMEFDSIITAIGQDVNLSFFPEKELKINTKTFETTIPNVYAGGDAVRGADSLINAIADGKKAAEQIISKASGSGVAKTNKSNKINLFDFQTKISKRVYGKDIPSIPLSKRTGFDLVHPLLKDEDAIKEAARCLYCDEICNICVTVCPNIANLYFEMEPVSIKYPVVSLSGNKWETTGQKEFSVTQHYQIFNIKDFCNECGNCDTFCPTAGAPYKVKPRFCLTKTAFENEDNVFFFENKKLLLKQYGTVHSIDIKDDNIKYKRNDLSVTFDENFDLIKIAGQNESTTVIDLKIAVEMYFYFLKLSGHPLFTQV